MFVQVPYCTSVAWSADGATLYTGYTDGQVCFRHSDDKQLLLGLSRPGPVSLTAHETICREPALRGYTHLSLKLL